MLEGHHGWYGAANTRGLCQGPYSGFYILLKYKQIITKQPTLYSKNKPRFGVPNVFSVQVIFKVLFSFNSLHIAIFWSNTSLLPVAASFITRKSAAWPFFNGCKLIKGGQKILESILVEDEIEFIFKYFMLMKLCPIVWIAGDSDNVKIYYFSCSGMEYLRLTCKENSNPYLTHTGTHL